jgi:hypothetical protein
MPCTFVSLKTYARRFLVLCGGIRCEDCRTSRQYSAAQGQGKSSSFVGGRVFKNSQTGCNALGTQLKGYVLLWTE